MHLWPWFIIIPLATLREEVTDIESGVQQQQKHIDKFSPLKPENLNSSRGELVYNFSQKSDDDDESFIEKISRLNTLMIHLDCVSLKNGEKCGIENEFRSENFSFYIQMKLHTLQSPPCGKRERLLNLKVIFLQCSFMLMEKERRLCIHFYFPTYYFRITNYTLWGFFLF